MQIGVVFPQTEIGADVGPVKAYAQAAEELGYAHLLAYDHVVGADPAVHAPWHGPYDIDTTFHEPFVLFGYLAAVTTMELVTGIIIVPQRQTVLVAKQAAEVDLLTQGRFRLGVGIGWNPVEYQALNMSFGDRGRRSEEQIEVMRRLWTERSVTFEGRHHLVEGAGIAPLPVQRPIPVWIGGSSPRAYERIGRVADGWFPQVAPGPRLDEALLIVAGAARAAGRDPASLGIEGRVNWTDGGAETVAHHAAKWQASGATHLTINTMNAGLATVDDHIAALAAAAEALGVVPARGERATHP
jgi:probable F420-dependent oxidoreductase